MMDLCTIIHLCKAENIFFNTHISYLQFTKKETNGEISLFKFSPGDLRRCMSLLYFPRLCIASLDIYRVAGPWYTCTGTIVEKESHMQITDGHYTQL